MKTPPRPPPPARARTRLTIAPPHAPLAPPPDDDAVCLASPAPEWGGAGGPPPPAPAATPHLRGGTASTAPPRAWEGRPPLPPPSSGSAGSGHSGSDVAAPAWAVAADRAAREAAAAAASSPGTNATTTTTSASTSRSADAGLVRRTADGGRRASVDASSSPSPSPPRAFAPPRGVAAVFMSTDHALRRATAAAGGGGGPHGRTSPPPPPPRAALAAPLPLTREVEARIQSLGTELPATHKAVLWAGVGLDVASKASLAAQLVRFALDGATAPAASLAAFVAASSAAVTGYWLAHYPGTVAERAARARAAARGGSPPRAPPRVRARALVRRLGTLCAVLQLGTAFAAARALRSSEPRQRLVAMDLRGMRLADTAFLTLGVACLNAFLQVRCAAPGTPCLPGGGRAVLRAASVGGALLSAALAHLALEMNDRRLAAGDARHAASLAALTVYRATEAAARVGLLAVFGGVTGPWMFAVVGVHAAAVACLLAARGGARAGAPRPWTKVASPSIVTVPRPLAAVAAWCCAGRGKKKKKKDVVVAGEGTAAAAVPPSPRLSPTRTARATLRLPAPSDACLLAACLAWPPSFYVSDATDAAGAFWWRARMHGRKSAASLAPRDALVPFWAYALLVYAEAAVMLGVLLHRGEPWAAPYVTAAAAAVGAWGCAGAVWLAVEAGSAAVHAADDAALDRATAAVDAAVLDALDSGGGGRSPSPTKGCDACAAGAATTACATPPPPVISVDVEAGIGLLGRRVAGSDSGASPRPAEVTATAARPASDGGGAGVAAGAPPASRLGAGSDSTPVMLADRSAK